MRAFLFALGAILLWSTLALAGIGLKEVPPFFLLGVTLGSGGAAGLAISFIRGRGKILEGRLPLSLLLVGVGGIFGYHFFYFRAFALAPAVEVNLINYLWPLLIVVLAPLILPGYRLSPQHCLGALFGLAGAGLIATGGTFQVDLRYLPGYLLAGAAALTWAIYSLMTKRLPPFPTVVVGIFCLISGALSLFVHFLSSGVPELAPGQWLGLGLAGLGPLGAAFYFWDAALKQGDPRVIGALAYLTPLFSSLNLVVFGGQQVNVIALTAMTLIVLGACIGALPIRFLFRKT